MNQRGNFKCRFGIAIALFVMAFCVPNPIFADDTADALKKQLQEIEAQIAQDQKEIVKIKGQANTLANTIKKLQAERAVLLLRMKAADAQIRVVEVRLQETQEQVVVNSAHLDALREQMAELLQVMYISDSEPLIYALLQGQSFSDIIATAQEYLQITNTLNDVITETHQTKERLTQQEADLTQRQEEATHLQSIRTIQQASLAESMDSQKTLLVQTKGKEQEYQAVLGDRKAQANQIKQRIYELLDTGTTHITFGQAVEIAKGVSNITGIRPAFILSVLSQESNLGKNVGTCNRPGDPPSKSWKVVMKPERDQKPFIAITDALVRNPDTTPVSCPMRDAKGNQIGWGGAMGPAQFIPSTWVGYQAKITKITGKPADPWDIRDAFLASALKLTNDGADGSEQGEWNAAMRYFSGSTNVKYRFYGDQVIARAAEYQKDIDAL